MDVTGVSDSDWVEVSVDFYGSFRDAAGTGHLSVRFPTVRTVRELLQGLTAKFGERFEAALLGEDGALKHDAVLLLNQAVLTMRELGRVLKTGDRVTLYQTISGG